MAQVPFVIICERGHLDDFPWREWVHRTITPDCTEGVLRLVSEGGGSLSSQRVKCDACGAGRTLHGITTARRASGSTTLTEQLDPNDTFTCRGTRPWVNDPGSGCGAALRATLRGSSNVYFPVVESSIYLPLSNADPEIEDVMAHPAFNSVLAFLHRLHEGTLRADDIRKADQYGALTHYTDEQIEAAAVEQLGPPTPDPPAQDEEDLEDRQQWRAREWEILRTGIAAPELTVSAINIAPELGKYLDRVRLVPRLRETRALRGFTRVHDAPLSLAAGKRLMRRNPVASEHDWLPAYSVSGEGLYIELDGARLAAWEADSKVRQRAAKLADRHQILVRDRGMRPRQLTARFILLHTLSHLLINQLIYECGYSSASLRERLYAPNEGPVAGMLIYTAAGDSEGTLGGLVRMGQPSALARVFDQAISRARWCASDPVCMELGASGQGPDSCNMAACYGCALLPETACEEFNRFLDRGLIIGTLDGKIHGYFS